VLFVVMGMYNNFKTEKKKPKKKKRTDDVFGCFSFQKEERKKIGKLSELKF